MPTTLKNMPGTDTQHFFLRLDHESAPKIPLRHKTPPVGVIAFKLYDGTKDVIKISGSMTSKKDAFVRSRGVKIATERLNSDATSITIPISEAEHESIACFAAELGLMTRKANYFDGVDWEQANTAFHSALRRYKERMAVAD